ncbi:unnamed protein product [Allacma fusca]|uniref:Uncharacterized protein n=1 Tax=Allacma fusca TaxID=39272 RepID=A0A8J2LG54_9HEXA|nr:unnamed protein product [Allacma fusca]
MTSAEHLQKLKSSKNKGTQNTVNGRLNSRRYFWLVVGYYIASVYLKQVRADADLPHGGTSDTAGSPGPDLFGIPTDDPGDHGGGHGIHITKVDFEGVETPFIIALWIFCASLAKIAMLMLIVIFSGGY